MRTGVAALLAGGMLVACSDGQELAAPQDDATDQGAEAGAPGGDADSESTSDEDAPPTSSLERTGQHARSEVEIRVAEILTDLEASAAPEGAVVEIEDTVLFDFDSADLRSQASDVLDELVELLDLLDDAPAEVRGHTDDVGSDDYNLRLSRDRAQAVADYFTDNGISSARLSIEGLGASEPVADNANPDGSDNPDGRARNRRVEVVLPTVDMEQLPTG
jgi:outer membrane protein OmpA-like peptidoglycan-associated protein